MAKKRQVEIRRAKLLDIPVLQKLSSELIISDARFDPLLQSSWSHSEDGKKYLTRRVRGRNGVCFVAVIDTVIVGYVTGGLLRIQKWRPIKRSELDNIYVKNTHRGQGVGSKLLQEFISWSKSKQVDRVMLYAAAGNERGITFYKKHAFLPEQIILETSI